VINMLPIIALPSLAEPQPAVAGTKSFDILLASSVASADFEQVPSADPTNQMTFENSAELTDKLPLEAGYVAFINDAGLKPPIIETETAKQGADETPTEGTVASAPAPAAAPTIVPVPINLPKSLPHPTDQTCVRETSDNSVVFMANKNPVIATVSRKEPRAVSTFEGQHLSVPTSFAFPLDANIVPTPEPGKPSPPLIANNTASPVQSAVQLDLARDLAWIANLAQEIVIAAVGTERLTFRLMPQSLGQLDIELVHSPVGLAVEMTATTERAAQIIATEQPRLIEELRQAGVKMLPADHGMGQHAGSQRHSQHRNEPSFAANTPPPQTAKTAPRASSRFA
jgi:flagellar hook-length control protein FliK